MPDSFRKRALRDIEDTMNQPTEVDQSVREAARKISQMRLPTQGAEAMQQPLQQGPVNPLGMLSRDKAFQEIGNTREQIGNEENAAIKEKLESFGESALTEREQEKLRNMPQLRQMLMGK
jgi:hypothetical protein